MDTLQTKCGDTKVGGQQQQYIYRTEFTFHASRTILWKLISRGKFKRRYKSNQTLKLLLQSKASLFFSNAANFEAVRRIFPDCPATQPLIGGRKLNSYFVPYNFKIIIIWWPDHHVTCWPAKRQNHHGKILCCLHELLNSRLKWGLKGMSMRLQCLCILYSNFLLFVFWNSTFFLSTHFPTFTLQTGLKIPFISNFWYLETSWTFWPDWKSSCFRLVKISRPTLIKKMPRTTTEKRIFLWWRKGPPS